MKRKKNPKQRTPEQEFKYNLKLLKDRIYKFEKNHNLVVDIESLREALGLDFRFDEQYYQEYIDIMWNIRGEIFNEFAYETGPTTDEPVPIEDAVIDRLFEFVLNYSPSIGLKQGTNRRKTLERRIARRRDELLTMLEDRINEVGKKNVALQAEQLQSAEELCVRFMFASDEGEAGMILMNISRLVFGRAATFGELVMQEDLNEYNGRFA